MASLKERLGHIICGYTPDNKPIRAKQLKAHGAMTVLLKDAINPNLVQTLENNPAIIHGGAVIEQILQRPVVRQGF